MFKYKLMIYYNKKTRAVAVDFVDKMSSPCHETTRLFDELYDSYYYRRGASNVPIDFIIHF